MRIIQQNLIKRCIEITFPAFSMVGLLYLAQ